MTWNSTNPALVEFDPISSTTADTSSPPYCTGGTILAFGSTTMELSLAWSRPLNPLESEGEPDHFSHFPITPDNATRGPYSHRRTIRRVQRAR